MESKNHSPKIDESDELDIDITDNYFYFLHQNNQEISNPIGNDNLIPNVAGGMFGATNFVLEATTTTSLTGKTMVNNVLIGTGANISTITQKRSRSIIVTI